MAGKICCWCKRAFDNAPWQGGERACDKCRPQPHHKVYMSYFHRSEGWVYQFLEMDLKTPVGRIRTCKSEDALRELIGRTPTVFKLEDKQAIDYGFRLGRSAVDLELTQEQYGKLKSQR